MESQPQNPEFRINPENFHQCSAEGLWKYHALLIRPAPISFGTRDYFYLLVQIGETFQPKIVIIFLSISFNI